MVSVVSVGWQEAKGKRQKLTIAVSSLMRYTGFSPVPCSLFPVP
nr:hypothetical protein [Moorena producens]